MAVVTYYASRISENLGRMPDTGFLLCRDAVIARTGYQRYSVQELPKDQAEQLGIDLTDHSAYVDLYRAADEVFSSATIASFEGQTICDEHPPEFVDAENFRQYARGHAQNIRRGDDPLDDGNLPLLADLIVTDADLIQKIENGLRELSCGYSYSLARDGNRLVQSQIRGNHIALVTRGRAGPEARIYDSGATEPPVDATESAEVAPRQTELAKPELRQITNKEKAKVKVTNWFSHITGLGLKALAADTETKPEDFADAAIAIGKVRAHDSEEETEAEEKRKKEADSKRAKDEAEEKERKDREDKAGSDKKAKDAAEAEEKEKKDKEAKDAADKAAKDAEPEHFANCKVKDCNARDCRMHGALDSILDKHPEQEGEDADMDELQELLTQFLGEEAGGTEHQDGSEMIEPVTAGGSEQDAAKDARAEEAEREAEYTFLKKMRPVVARSNDQAIIDEFNARLNRFTSSPRASKSTYAGVARGAAARDNDFKDENTVNKELDEMYASFHGKTYREVK